ncbi:PREDICTED: probable serine/threonine-protein kinase At1g09600 [Camelina sativa]|uniref:Probable serine/threonine-protein kinase At1g09600 n=1 Tax=Camelina sativa TaxID=90675 RepID=A0ABM0XZQ9_CAMSA|nr:PREDICTED: probable serine/threonine-protein kinase At1g09600 [Camelina sativa]XP_010493322.1 PREDICTED: probable serine/threonine-protein kinase At1g09600 [Camelina sativa]
MGCIISKRKSPKKNPPWKEPLEKRSSRITSSRIDDSSQTKEEQDRLNKVMLIESDKFSSSRFSEKQHLEISEIGDTDADEDDVHPPTEELKREPSVLIRPCVETVSKEAELAAGWPAWLVSVAGEALVNWTPRRASTFEKLEKIGQGTYSSVYKARDLLNNKIVALKRVRFDLSDLESVKFMAREIIVMRRLDHDLVGLASIPGIKFSEPQVTTPLLCFAYSYSQYINFCRRQNKLGSSAAYVKCYMQQLLKN